MNINISFLEKEMLGTSVPKPLSGTLSGHAAGEPFDKHVYCLIKDKFDKITYRQYEFLNNLYLKNPSKITTEERHNLISSPVLRFLLNRGKGVTKNWTNDNQFIEKQNDTADILVIKDNFFNIIDVKTQNLDLDGQPPNIISAYKLARVCEMMIKNNSFDDFEIVYIGVGWVLKKEALRCKEICIKELFKTSPDNLYVNWAAAMQIQFHVKRLDQRYDKSIKFWCRDYLKSFIKQAKNRSDTMTKKFVSPFKKFI